MSENTISALIDNGIKYFVFHRTNNYRLISYPKLSTKPFLIELPLGCIWAFPISVETYGSPWFSIKNMVDSGLFMAEKSGIKHISILCHPFRDGNSFHIRTTRRLLEYLIRRKLRPITLTGLMQMLENMKLFIFKTKAVGEFLDPKKAKMSFPSTKWDIFGLIPQSSISILRRAIKRSHF